MNRREWLKLITAGAAAVACPITRSYVYAAEGASDTKFLLVFLRGGYDAANVLVPVGSSFYYESRPTLAIARPDSDNPDAALSLARPGDAADWGLHPALRETMLPLWQKGELAFVPFAGTNDLSRSHFETQDSVEQGSAGDASASGRHGSGFLNRLAVVLGGKVTPVAFTDGLPVVMAGDVMIPNVSLKGNARAPFDDRQTQLLARMYSGTRFEPIVNEGFELRKSVAEQVAMMESGGTNGEMQAANRNAISARGFELEARRMGGLMRDRFNLGFIDVGGWDTHVNQGGAQGQLATLLGNLGAGLSAFAQQMGLQWKNTVVVVISEFGRTFRENGTRGTDHGHGTAYWVLGGAVQGGRIAGEQRALDRAALNQDRDWPVLNEYRSVLGGLFTRMYGLNASQLSRVFPGAVARDANLL